MINRTNNIDNDVVDCGDEGDNVLTIVVITVIEIKFNCQLVS